ncbi:aminobenzoyl-glutamate utilization protein A [Sphingomonas sp. UYP23]
MSQSGAVAPSLEAMIADRRDLHAHAEPGWCEVYAATKVYDALSTMGWEIRAGAAVIDADARLGLPPQSDFDFFFARAVENGAEADLAETFRDGFTGLVAVWKGRRSGPVVAFRFDLDANRGAESENADHVPVARRFVSMNHGVHHNCGHDGHTSLGLALARSIAAIDGNFAGEIRLIFQPAEEGLRGARAMVAAGVLGGVDYFVGCHIGIQATRTGEVVSGYTTILGSDKLDVHFHGVGAHAAIAPHEGRNALLAACVAAQNLMAIPRHGKGDTRINIGTLVGGNARNTVPAEATMTIELRAEDAESLAYINEAARRIIEGAAIMHGVELTMEVAGGSGPASSDPDLDAVVAAVAAQVSQVTRVVSQTPFKGSEDAAEMMRAVQEQGGKAVYFGIGSDLAAGHHNAAFDFDEASLAIGLDILCGVAATLTADPIA